MTPRLHQRLLELPLFQGMSLNDLNNVMARTRFGFIKVAQGKRVVSEGDPCEHIYFLMNGSLSAKSRADDGSYAITETMKAPDVLQPERIFGFTQRFTKTFTAQTECQMLRLTKSEILRLSQEYEIFHLNLLNIVCTQSQRLTHLPWRQRAIGIRQKICRFVEQHCQRPAGEKTLTIKMQTLASEIGESRLNVSRELRRMKDENLISYSRNTITIPALERLLS